jgi:cytochrome c
MSTLERMSLCRPLLLGRRLRAIARPPAEGPRRHCRLGDISIPPDGTGLPAGSGTAAQGAPIFAAKCAMCHGEGAKGTPAAAALVGAPPLTGGIETTKTIANFWGYSTTAFDFIRRAMPFQAPRTLTNDEVYALVAYIFALNKLIRESEVMNAKTLPQVKMPNRDGFIIRFPERI